MLIMMHVSTPVLRLIFVAAMLWTSVCQAQHAPADSVGHSSAVAFQLPETGLITEGIAYDPLTKTFFVGSVHERKLISYSAKTGAHTFSQSADSLWGMFGLCVDSARRLLWACSSALPQARGVTPAQDGQTALVAYDLRTNRLKRTYPVAADGKPHLLGDLIAAKNGTVYTTDSRTPWLYRLKAGEQTVTPFLTDSLFYSLQGLALSDDEQTLYVADYRRGPLAVNLATKKVTRLPSQQPADLSGIDGLYYYRHSLIAIQNRVKPYRVIRLHLSKTTEVIERVEVLETGHPLTTEPTLGVVVDGQFFYIANSQWDAFDNSGKSVPNYPAQKPTILRLPLK